MKIIFTGMERSGQHAVQDWVLSQVVGRPVAMYGDCDTQTDHGKLVYSTAGDGPEVVGLNYESQPMTAPVFKRHSGCPTVLVVRDLGNNLASYLKLKGGSANVDAFVRVWEQHVQEFMGRTCEIPNLLPVYFTLWAQDAAYRRAIIADMANSGLPVEFSDSGRDRVLPTCSGLGSSFDGMGYDGRGSEMPVWDRARHLPRRYRSIVDDHPFNLALLNFKSVAA